MLVMGKFKWFEPSGQPLEYHLDKMTLRELVSAYFLYPAIQIYLVLLGVSLVAVIWLRGNPLRTALAAAAIIVVYPVVEYLIHRFVLHAPLYRWSRMATFWKRVHYDHHCDPNNLRVLFGRARDQLFTVTSITLPIGAAIGGPAGMAAAFSAGLLCLMSYEFCHCVQHLRFVPSSDYFRTIKRNHLLHHFHNEQGNFGITGYAIDRVFGTGYRDTHEWPHSATVHNLGYAGEKCVRYPWVRQLSEEACSGGGSHKPA
jgi:sterol desaturase/sphingolipid hydroxylase (fatty acid hydroxylase superfamily)